MTQILDKHSALDADNMPVALLQLDRKRRIQAMNSRAEALFGFSRQAGQGKRLSDVLYHDCALFDLADRAAETYGQISVSSLKLQGPGVKQQEGLHASVAVTGDGGFAIVLTQNAIGDVSEVDTAGLAAFGRILGHEVKNPLAGLSGAAQLLLREADQDQVELLELILAESERIHRLIDKFSAFELFSAPRQLPCNVHQILEQVIRSEEVAFEKRVKFERNFDPSLPDILADGDHLHEAFQNIVRNAAEAVRDHTAGDTVTISTRFSLDHRNIGRDGNVGQRALKVSISDNGPGISKLDQKSIFEMFQTTKPNGSGLGLTVASQVLTAHGGHITLDSRNGLTVFNLYLPIAKAV